MSRCEKGRRPTQLVGLENVGGGREACRPEQVARARGINASQLFAWRRQALAKGLISDNRPESSAVPALTFASVTVAEEEATEGSSDGKRPARRRRVPRGSAMIEIELKSGDRVRVEGSVDAVLIARIVAALRRT